MEVYGKVSIVVPVYNCEKYVERCIRSLMSQTYRNLEIIVIDDGSTDRSMDVLQTLAETDDRIIVIRQENQGVSAARNQGLDAATGEYLTFVDSDDYVAVDYIEDFVKCQNEKKADMLIGGLCMVDSEDRMIQSIIPGEYIRGQHEEWAFRLSAVAAHFYRRSIWEQYHIRFCEGERGEDMPIALFFSAACRKIITVPCAKYYYMQHEASASSHFQGLREYNLPYHALTDMIQKIQLLDTGYDREFHVLFLLRIFCTCIHLAKGADRCVIAELESFITNILDQYYPDYISNKRVCMSSDLDIPLGQKAAVKALVLACRLNMLPLFLKVVC